MATRNSFKIGDQVQLISGGPAMTVTSETASSSGHIFCSWFSGKKHETGHFPPDALKPFVKEVSDEKA